MYHQAKYLKTIHTLQFQIIVLPSLSIFEFFVDTSFLVWTLPQFLIFQILFCRYFRDVKTDCSICETVSSLFQTILIIYQFWSRLNLECKLSHFSHKCEREKHVRGQTPVTNSRAAAHESWLVRYSPCSLRFIFTSLQLRKLTAESRMLLTVASLSLHSFYGSNRIH